MTQLEIPPYRRPRSPLDLVAVENIFGHLFKAFQYASRAAGTGTLAGDDSQPLKKRCIATEDNACAKVSDNSLLPIVNRSAN
jgi:hypothetical protein